MQNRNSPWNGPHGMPYPARALITRRSGMQGGGVSLSGDEAGSLFILAAEETLCYPCHASFFIP